MGEWAAPVQARCGSRRWSATRCEQYEAGSAIRLEKAHSHAAVLGLKPERLSASRPLDRTGMDTMMTVQLRNDIDRHFKVRLPLVKILRDSSVDSPPQAIADTKAATAADRAPERA
ncbi:acyl carrier protein [Actinacidiphila glaucinigra]|uniref:acyl carrier protein n=1 Tax=Actinacidiphila glaucinigra TaxID=235986 RepID=UPI0035DC867E